MTTQHPKKLGMRVFILIWFGQMVSLIGSGLTNFALGVWVYQQTGSVTQFALISLFTSLPTILISPVAGALVDRWPRRWVMIISDFGAGLSTGAIALQFAMGHLATWHIYIATAVSSCFSAFQWPAYVAATTTLVAKQNLGRANGMLQLGDAAARLVSPLLAGVLLITIQLQGIILIDFATFVFALVTLARVRFPKGIVDTHKADRTSLFKEITYGLTYILLRKGLLWLLVFFAVTNFLVGVVQVLVTPLILSFASPTALGFILTIGGVGMLMGSVVMSTLKGPQQRIKSVFGFMFLGGLCIMAAGFHKSVPLLALIAFLFFFGQPIINSSTLVIFQKKVASHVQGRVFALISAIANASLPFAYVVAGPLADRIFEPLMKESGPLAGSIGQIIGVGSGRGIGLMFIVMGVLTVLVTIIAYQYPPLRFVENQLPDAIADDSTTTAEIEAVTGK
jgi:MFS transporter, DHA3 family, macrolide efflux protein